MPASASWIRRSSLSSLLKALALFRVVIAGHHPLSIVNKDVAILGGGASGTYAAVRLREDYGKSVLLIEKEAILVEILINMAIGGYGLTMLNREATSTRTTTPRPARHSTTESNLILIIRVPKPSSNASGFRCNPTFSSRPIPSMLIQIPAS